MRKPQMARTKIVKNKKQEKIYKNYLILPRQQKAK